MADQSQRCPQCGASSATSNYCTTCGSPLGARPCRACGAIVAAGARFCGQCGASASDASSRSQTPKATLPWIVAAVGGVAIAAILIMLVRRDQASIAAAAQSSAGEPVASAEAPPDISSMSPRERFDRLYNRIMRAAESGDEATVTRFTPMALMAYAQLPDIDADARYHAALLKVHTGDADGARALADTILAQNPAHLFGFLIRGTVARWQKDQASLATTYAAFLSHYDAEMKADRPEYSEHSRALEEFRQAAQGKKPVSGTESQ
jgi:phosphate/sulfate permease